MRLPPHQHLRSTSRRTVVQQLTPPKMERRTSTRLSKKLNRQIEVQNEEQLFGISILRNEIVVMIFKMLDLNTLVKCRLVSKRWNAIASALKVVKLSVVRDSTESSALRDRYLFTNDLVNSGSRIFSKRLNFLKIDFMKELLSRVKKISIDDIYGYGGQFDWSLFESTISKFNELEQLQINSLTLSESKNLCLPNVEVFTVIYTYFSGDIKLKLTAPKLVKLGWLDDCLSHLELDCAKNITHLVTTEAFLQNEKRFEGVEILCLKCNYNNDSPTYFNDLLRDLPKLREIHYDTFSYRPYMIERLNKVKASSNPNIKLSFNDFLVADRDDIEDLPQNIVYDGKLDTRTLLDNYAKLVEVVTSIHQLDYSMLIKEFGGMLPTNFTTRFIAIKKVWVNEVIGNVGTFVEFIKSCELLNVLILKNASLDQEFYNDLHVYCGLITELIIEESKESFVLDSSFILKHKNLRIYSVNQNVPIDLIKFVFKNSQKFKNIIFMLKDRKIDFSFKYGRGSIKVNDGDLSDNNRSAYLKAMSDLFSLF